MLPQSAHSEYAAWLVDLDGTLYRGLPVKLAMAAELMLVGWGAVNTLRSFRQAHELLRGAEANPGGTPFQRQLELTAERLGRPVEEVERLVEEWMFQRPLKWLARAQRRALLDAIRSYRASGGRTALVSDYPARGKLMAMGVMEHFELLVSNGEPDGPRQLKPHPEGFLSAATRLGVEPARCLVIGDRDDADGAAARAAGMGFFLVR